MAMKPGNGGGGNGERDPRLDRLYRDTPRETPPPHLDAAIRAAARREVGARPRAVSPLRRWRVPVSIAAVVVLTVSLVTLVREEGGDSPILMRDYRVPVASPDAQKAESPQQPVETAKVPESGEWFAASRNARKRAAPAPEELALRRDEAAAKPAQPKSTLEQEQARSSAAPAAAPEAAAPTAETLSGMLSSRAIESSSSRRAEADEAKARASIGVRGMSADSGPQAAAPQSPKPIAEGPVVQDRPRPVQKKAAPAPAWRGLEQEPPEKWLERMADLRKQGRAGEADELLIEFKRRFPDHPLPSGLK